MTWSEAGANVTNHSHTLVFGNGTGVDDDTEYARLFALYGSWAAPVIGTVGFCGFLLNMAEIYTIGRTPALRNNNTSMMLIAGTCVVLGVVECVVWWALVG